MARTNKSFGARMETRIAEVQMAYSESRLRGTS